MFLRVIILCLYYIFIFVQRLDNNLKNDITRQGNNGVVKVHELYRYVLSVLVLSKWLKYFDKVAFGKATTTLDHKKISPRYL